MKQVKMSKEACLFMNLKKQRESKEREMKDKCGCSSSAENPNPCPICLCPVIQHSYLDRCFHKFCYNCILQWTRVVASKHATAPSSVQCPLCKTENSSIIHGCVGDSFLRHYVDQIYGVSSFFSKAHRNRLRCYYTEPGTLNDIFDVSRYWKMRKYLQPNRWLQSWLRREIQALIQEEDVDIIVHHILGVYDSSVQRYNRIQQAKPLEEMQEEFKVLVSDAARPFLTERTDRFVNELELFLSSGLNLEAYDEVYMKHLGWNSPRIMEEECTEQRPVIPYLYIFSEDSDGPD